MSRMKRHAEELGCDEEINKDINEYVAIVQAQIVAIESRIRWRARFKRAAIVIALVSAALLAQLVRHVATQAAREAKQAVVLHSSFYTHSK